MPCYCNDEILLLPSSFVLCFFLLFWQQYTQFFWASSPPTVEHASVEKGHEIASFKPGWKNVNSPPGELHIVPTALTINTEKTRQSSSGHRHLILIDLKKENINQLCTNQEYESRHCQDVDALTSHRQPTETCRNVTTYGGSEGTSKKPQGAEVQCR